MAAYSRLAGRSCSALTGPPVPALLPTYQPRLIVRWARRQVNLSIDPDPLELKTLSSNGKEKQFPASQNRPARRRPLQSGPDQSNTRNRQQRPPPSALSQRRCTSSMRLDERGCNWPLDSHLGIRARRQRATPSAGQHRGQGGRAERRGFQSEVPLTARRSTSSELLGGAPYQQLRPSAGNPGLAARPPKLGGRGTVLCSQPGNLRGCSSWRSSGLTTPWRVSSSRRGFGAWCRALQLLR